MACKDVRVKPGLHPLTGEFLTETRANKTDEAILDIAARGFWVNGQKAFFDVRVINPIAGRYKNLKIEKACEVNEKEKKRTYNQRVLQIEQGTFTPLVFTAMGGCGREVGLVINTLNMEIERLATKSLSRHMLLLLQSKHDTVALSSVEMGQLLSSAILSPI